MKTALALLGCEAIAILLCLALPEPSGHKKLFFLAVVLVVGFALIYSVSKPSKKP